MIALAILVALGPLAGPAAALAGARARPAGVAQAAGAAVAFGCSLALLAMLDGGRPLFAWDGFLYVDALGGFFLMTVGAVTLLAAIGSISYVAAQEDDGELSGFQVRLYFSFFGLFASLMLAALETGNLGLLFVLVEASTLASAALVGLEGRARSLEAAWKYVIISSLGVTIALAGTLFLFYSGSALRLGSNLGLTWPYLVAHAGGWPRRACAWRSCWPSWATAPRSGWHRCTPGCPTRTPRHPARPAPCCPPRCSTPGCTRSSGSWPSRTGGSAAPTRGPCCCPSGSPPS